MSLARKWVRDDARIGEVCVVFDVAGKIDDRSSGGQQRPVSARVKALLCRLEYLTHAV
jgi:hypothetical protein